MMKKVAIVSAMAIEIYYVHEYLDKRENWEKINEDTYENKEKQLTVTAQILGVGKVNAAYKTTEIIYQFQPDLIVNVGYAGGLIDNGKKGDVVIGNDYVQVDFKPLIPKNNLIINKSPKEVVDHLEAVAEKLGFSYFTGKIATGDFFLNSTEKKNKIRAEYNTVAFDMESAAVAQVATKKEVDFVALRTFSDLADDNAKEAITDNSEKIEHKPIILTIEAIENF
ncbi:MAG: 5'-methylthioadenosine/S-adenosylhomocysteine nucleosidase [Clostridiaceae bacterium]